ncbi:MAG: CBS domain-containing protein [Gemmatimonadetes bacterium]|nr:CBS domain-containing protein [Gemmatimonadota bacterium]MYA63924.1 CBS domain-containing protein [Gemmatimonadota bacterium]MYB98488.1 CBS domain-containing protein [Gemmatimonadota bacterium]MYH51877.1 CBS domain-containing protein [Gemmatimonadota bacterium]MYK65570.1 CBS domain-containing protein [Gemmatimonadota bacterium]
MPPIPYQLLAVQEDIAAGKRRWAKVKTLLSWFGQKGRGKHVVQTIQEALNEAGLFTRPEFTPPRSVHDYIEFKALTETVDGPEVDSTGDHGSGGGTKPPEGDQTESADGNDGREPTSPEGTGSKFCIGMLEAANRPNEILTIARDKTVEEAATLMIMHRYSQLPVTQDKRRIYGMISWRSMGRVRARGDACEHVRDCLEPVRILDQDAPFFKAVDTITDQEVVLVRGKDRTITGIVTTSDLSQEYHQKAAPFLLLGEVEDRIRVLIRRNLSAEEIKKARDPGDDTREIEDAADLTFGEYVRLLESRENWKKLRLGIDRKLFIGLLNDVREVRNDVMHFRPDSSEPEDLDKVRMLHSLLEQLVQ